jgi:hypothetical protein
VVVLILQQSSERLQSPLSSPNQYPQVPIGYYSTDGSFMLPPSHDQGCKRIASLVECRAGFG